MPQAPRMFVTLIFFVWFLWVVACAAQAGLRGARAGLPPERRPGTSILGGFPLFPLFFWGIAWAIDQEVSPWGTRIVGAGHVLLGAMLVVSIVRDSRKTREIDRRG